MNVNSEPQGVA